MSNKVTISVKGDDFQCSIRVDKELAPVSSEWLSAYEYWLKGLMKIALGAIYSGRLSIVARKISEVLKAEKREIGKEVS